MENYILIKEEIAKNQTSEDFCVLNYEDKALREFGESECLQAKAVFFSSKNILDKGVYIKNGGYSGKNGDYKRFEAGNI